MISKVKKLIISAFASILLLTGALATTADAQGRHKRRPQPVIIYQPYYPFYIYNPSYYPGYCVVTPGSHQWRWGYREGRDEGDDDADDGKPMNPAGDKDFYKSSSCSYRQAYIQGYYDAYWKEIRD